MEAVQLEQLGGKAPIILAVSGGVDSVVLLDLLVRAYADRVVVAHFDHGIRPDSSDNAQFVQRLAAGYGVPCEVRQEELGVQASEALARERRYRFLRAVAARHDATLVTAHHADDVVETVAINLVRGTGWRGLAVLDAPGVYRPLQEVPKKALYMYATQHDLSWYEDSTNASDKYLRNRMRRRLAELDNSAHGRVRTLVGRQRHLKSAIDAEAARLLPMDGPYGRYPFIMYPTAVAVELLRSLIARDAGYRPTEAQARAALLAIKTAKSGRQHDITKGVRLEFGRSDFIVRGQPKVL